MVGRIIILPMHNVLKTFHGLATVLILFVAITLAGCVILPLSKEEMNTPALKNIHAAFARTVTQALNDPNENWTSGWLGNMWVNYHEDRQRGLCYQWKYRVHAGVKKAVHAEGWELTGIVINEGVKHEHHAVVVYDPKRITADKLLKATPRQPVYILDAWRQGQPDIYHMADWLQLPAEVTVAAKLIEVVGDEIPVPH